MKIPAVRSCSYQTGPLCRLRAAAGMNWCRGGSTSTSPSKPTGYPPETRRPYEQHEATHSRRRRDARSRWHRFADAVRQQVPGGAELMNQTQEMLEIYGEVIEQEARQKARQEGRREGELRGRVLTIEGFLGRRCAVVHHRSGHRSRRGCVSPAQAPGGGRGRRHPPPRLRATLQGSAPATWSPS